MRITGLEVFEDNIPLKTPFITAKRRIDVIKYYVVKLSTDEGLCGYGACAPTPVITGDTDGSILYALNEYYKPLLVGAELNEELLPFVQAKLFHNSTPKAALDIAIYDLLAQQAKKPLYAYLGGTGTAHHLKTDTTVSLGSVEKMTEDAKGFVAEGFSSIKVKLGGTKEEDIARIKALAEILPKDVIVRLDANQAWTPEDAVYITCAAEDTGMNLDLVEQPVHYEDFEGLAYVTKNTKIKILADESVFSPADARRIIRMGAADLINIKLMKCGGIYEALKIQKEADDNGVGLMLGCMMEGAISVAAAAHFAAAKGIERLDLDPPYLMTHVPTVMNTSFEGENIYINGEGFGLGLKSIS